jgi:hypothetical protein
LLAGDWGERGVLAGRTLVRLCGIRFATSARATALKRLSLIDISFALPPATTAPA